MANPVLTHHPLSAAFPAMSREDFESLKVDIKTNGQRDPITLYEGAVIDGWHRYMACSQLGITPKSEPLQGDPVSFVLSKNLHRRHLTPSQRALATVECMAWKPAGNPAQLQVCNVAPGATLGNAELAAAADVSPRTIRQAKVVSAGPDEVKTEVREGRMSVKQAAKAVRPPAKAPSVATPREEPTSGPVKVFKAPTDSAPEPIDAEEGACEDHTPSMAELLDEAQAEIEALTGKLKVAQADDQKAESLKWRDAYDQAVKGQSEAMERAKLAADREAWALRQLRRCGKAVGEDDPTKISAKVEAMARAAKVAA